MFSSFISTSVGRSAHLVVRRPRAARRAAVVLSAAALAAVAGCNNSGSGSASTRTPNAAVLASDTSRIPVQQSQATMAFPTGDPKSSALLVEQSGPADVRVGQPYTYQLKVTNLTDKPLTGVVLRETPPAEFAITNSTPATQPTQNGEIAYNLGDLGPRESRTISVTGTPTREGHYEAKFAADFTAAAALTTGFNVVAPALRLTKAGPDQADVCQDLAWKYTVSNTGTGVERNVTVTDALPDGLTTTDGQRVVSANVGDLAAGQSKDVTAHLKASKAGQYASGAAAKSDVDQVQIDPVRTVVRAPRLDVAVKAPEQEYVGKPVAYQVTVTNNGDAPAENAQVSLAASNQAQLVSVAGDNGAQLAADRTGPQQSIGTLAPGQSRTINVTFQDNQGGAMKVDATANAKCAGEAVASGTTHIITLPALLLEAVDNTDPIKVGDNVTYTITVKNQGTAPDQDVHVTATLPGSEQFVSTGGASNGTNDGQTVDFAPVATIEPGKSLIWTVQAKATQADQAQFKVNMTSRSITKPAEKIEPTRLY